MSIEGAKNRVIDYVKGMSVAWFSFNLATSAIILSSFALGNLERIGALIEVARILAAVNTLVFITTSILYVARIILGWSSFKKLLRNPVESPFLTVTAISAMLLSLDWSLVLGNTLMAAVFFYTGLIVHTALFIIVLYVMERHPGVEVHYMNPGWYMPAVGNVLVPYVGMILSAQGIHVSKSLLGIYLGTGTIMWMALFTIWLYRSIFFHPPPARLMATTWINLAPPAVIPLSYEALLGFTPSVYHKLLGETAGTPFNPVATQLLVAVFDFFYYTFWGAAGLLFALVIAITLGHLHRRDIEFAESWWAFVFPLAAYTISTIHLYLHHPGDTWLVKYAWTLYVLAWLFYLVTTGFSLYYSYEELVKKVPKEKIPRLARPLPEDLLQKKQGKPT